MRRGRASRRQTAPPLASTAKSTSRCEAAMPTTSFRVRAAVPADILALMRLKHLLASGEDSLSAVRATEFDWLRDGFGPKRGFTAFVAEVGDVVGMVTCSQRVIPG